MKRLGLITVLFLISVTSVLAKQNSLFVKVIDESGEIVPNTTLYIEGVKGTRFTGGKEISGAEAISLKSGHYQITASRHLQAADHVERQSSLPVSVHIQEGDVESVVLRLNPVEDIAILTSYYEMNMTQADHLTHGSY